MAKITDGALKQTLGSLSLNVDIAGDTICVTTGVSSVALHTARALQEALPDVTWHSARVDSNLHQLVLEGTDSSNTTCRLMFKGCMACGYRGSGPIDTAHIISALMPTIGSAEEVLRTIQIPNKGKSWKQSSYEFTLA